VTPEELLRPPTENEGGKGCGATISALSLLLLIPSVGIAMIAPMAGDSGTPSAIAVAFLLFFGPVLLALAAVAGFFCYRRYSRLRLMLALLLFTPLVVLYCVMLGS
jgi:hypothetical protein